MEAALRTVYEVVTGKELEKVDFTAVRGTEAIKEATVKVGDLDVNVAVVSGTANAAKLLDQIKAGEKNYQFIEVMKAGLASFYGAHILNDFGEPGRMAPYTEDLVRRLLFTAAPPGEIAASPVFSGHDTDWSRPGETRRWEPDCGYLPLQGGRARGPLLGGCFEVFDDLWDTPLFPPAEAFDGAILFYEVCGEPTEERYRARLRRFGEAGLLTRIAGLLMGKPLGGAAALTLYNRVTREVLAEYGRADLPVLANASFGHNAPSGVIPMGS